MVSLEEERYSDAGHLEAARMAAQMIINGEEVKFFVDFSLLYDELVELVGEEKAKELIHKLYKSAKTD
ncbi:MAG: hypothetical protein HQK55_05085 [Deltaproteobacteria bacterium]|nr:hypothetical protein [Deltaproteobacteria bacterium]